jgi:hypothetical protein
VLKIEAVLDQRSAREGVVADPVAMNPRIQQRQGEKKENKKPALVLVWEGRLLASRGGVVH